MLSLNQVEQVVKEPCLLKGKSLKFMKSEETSFSVVLKLFAFFISLLMTTCIIHSLSTRCDLKCRF